MRLALTLLATGVSLLALPGWAATYYVAPKGTTVSSSADGSKSKPLATPASALSRAKSGDTIILLDGNYDPVVVKNLKFTTPVTIKALNPKKARVESISMTGKPSGLVFRDLSVWSSNLSTSRGTRVDAGFATNVTFDNLDVRSAADASNYAGWSKEEWANHSLKGFQSRGANVTLSNSSFTGVGFGIVLMGENTKATNNEVRGFAMDAMRVLGDNSTVSGNLITDAVKINSNHPDGIQSWSQNGKPVKGLIIKDNTIVEWAAKKANPNRAPLQGVGFFDGYYDNLTISGNTIATTAYHGISVYGGRGVKVTGNTVVNGKGDKVNYPWIGIFDKKKGPPSSNVLVSGNKAVRYLGITDPANKVSSSGNTTISNPSATLKGILAGLDGVTQAASIKATPSELLNPDSPTIAVKMTMGSSTSVFLASADLADQGNDDALQGDPASVPLPAAIWPMIGGVAALIAVRRRRVAV